MRWNYLMYADETVERMAVKLSEATNIAERMFHTYFKALHELRQAEIPFFML